MALHRKAEALLSLQPDLAVISECAAPPRLRANCDADWIECEPVWIGENEVKGLAVFGFNGHRPTLTTEYDARLKYVAPVRISGPSSFNLLAVWAQNASAGITRKHQHGPLRRALTKYHDFLSTGPSVVAGDWNSNAIWDKPGWRINHGKKVQLLAEIGLVSAYHELTGEAHGKETVPTHYWRDRRRDGPTYHIDYVFMPRSWLEMVKEFVVGSYDDWCGNGLSDHVPIVVEIGV